MRSEVTAIRDPTGQPDIPRADDGTLPKQWLIAEWATSAAEPTDYWLASLPANTPISTLVHLAKIRWRIEYDYRELKTRCRTDLTISKEEAGPDGTTTPPWPPPRTCS